MHQYFMNLAIKESQNANCIRGKVGSVIVKNGEVLSLGNNSVPNGCNPCENCLRNVLNIKSGERQEICRAVHAEQNAIINAYKNKLDLEGATLYVTKSPCVICAKLIINAGIKKVVYGKKYADDLSFEMLKEAGVETELFEVK